MASRCGLGVGRWLPAAREQREVLAATGGQPGGEEQPQGTGAAGDRHKAVGVHRGELLLGSLEPWRGVHEARHEELRSTSEIEAERVEITQFSWIFMDFHGFAHQTRGLPGVSEPSRALHPPSSPSAVEPAVRGTSEIPLHGP